MFVSSFPVNFTDTEIEIFYWLLVDYKYQLDNLDSEYKSEFPDYVIQRNRVCSLIDKIENSGCLF